MLLIVLEAARVLPSSVRGGQIFRDSPFARDAIRRDLEWMLHRLALGIVRIVIIARVFALVAPVILDIVFVEQVFAWR